MICKYKLHFSIHNYIKRGRSSLKLVILPSLEYKYLGKSGCINSVMYNSSAHIISFSMINFEISCRIDILKDKWDYYAKEQITLNRESDFINNN